MARPDTQDIHVLHVVPRLGVGGMELALSRVANALVARGQRHSVVCLTGDADITERFDPSVRIYCMHAGSNDLSLPWRLWRLFREVNPTVIHARNWGAWPDTAIARLLLYPGPPLVFSFHGVTTTHRPPWRRRAAFRVLAMVSTKILTVSQASRRILHEVFGLPLRRIEVIPNGVDTQKFSPGVPRPADGRMIVGTVGSLTAVKNQAMLIRAFASAAAADPGRQWELRLAGRGPLRDELAGLAGSLGVGGRVRFVGHTDDVPGFLRELDVFVLSSDSEQHPNALIEAMACGLPCVATDVGGVREALDKGRCGLLVDAGDTGGPVNAMAALAADVNRRRGLGVVARERVRLAYSLDKMIEAYAALYEGLERRSRRPEGAQ
jgi:glycosyltransferase involved in cell wall biosynthesis